MRRTFGAWRFFDYFFLISFDSLISPIPLGGFLRFFLEGGGVLNFESNVTKLGLYSYIPLWYRVVAPRYSHFGARTYKVPPNT